MPVDKVEVGAGVGGVLAGAAGLLASAQDGSQIAEWIERIGLPAALLLGLVFCLYRAARYLTTSVIEPVTARHLTFVAKVEQAVQESAEANKRTSALVADLKQEASEDRKTVRVGFDKLRSAILMNGCSYPAATGSTSPARHGKLDPERTTTIQEDDGEHDA